MEYIFPKTNEKIKEERWAWSIVYEDETELKQFDKGIFHQVGEIEQDKIKLAVLYKLNDPSKRIDIVWQKGMRLIHKYRNIKPYYLETFVKVYMFGYKIGNKYHYNFVLPDDRIVMSSEDNISLEKFELQRAVTN